MSVHTTSLTVPRRTVPRLVPGLALSCAVAAAATALGTVVPLGSAPVIGIVLGLLVGAISGTRRAVRPVLQPGLRFAGSTVLRTAVVVLGLELPLGEIASEGVRSLPIIAVTLGGCLLAAGPLGGRLRIAERVRTLIGVGTGICGASAIAAVTPVIEASELEVGYAVATIFLFNVAAVLLFPPLGHLVGMSPHRFGVFAGTAVNDLSSVVAAAGTYPGSLHAAVVTKLTRTLAIVPISIVLRHRASREASTPAACAASSVPATSSAPAASSAPDAGRPARDRALSVARLVPGFLVAFLVLAAVRTIGLVPALVQADAGPTATVLITVALSAVGLSIDLQGLRRVGPRPVLLGLVLWLLVTGLALGSQALL